MADKYEVAGIKLSIMAAAQSQKLGYGDLATLDIARIARELEGPELFTVLDEHNSYQRYVKKASHLGGLAVVDETLLEGVRAEDQSALGIKDETSEVFPERTFVTFNAEFTVIKDGLLFRSDREGRASRFIAGIDETARRLTSMTRELDLLRQHRGEEAYEKRKADIWPGDDIYDYAQGLNFELLDPTDFVSTVTQLTAGQ